MREKETTPEAPAADRFDCVECGVGIASDEDGCCASCGRSVVIVRNHLPTYPASASEPPASTGERGGAGEDRPPHRCDYCGRVRCWADLVPYLSSMICRDRLGCIGAHEVTRADTLCALAASGERSPRAGTARGVSAIDFALDSFEAAVRADEKAKGSRYSSRDGEYQVEAASARLAGARHGFRSMLEERASPPPRSSGTTASEGGWCPNTTLRIPKGECGCCEDPEQGGEP